MNEVRPIARTDDTVTLRTSDYEALLSAVEDAEDAAALYAAGVREALRGTVEARSDHLSDTLVERLLAGESAVRIWREHRAMTAPALAGAADIAAARLADIEDGKLAASIAEYRALAAALGVAVDDLIISTGG